MSQVVDLCGLKCGPNDLRGILSLVAGRRPVWIEMQYPHSCSSFENVAGRRPVWIEILAYSILPFIQSYRDLLRSRDLKL